MVQDMSFCMSYREALCRAQDRGVWVIVMNGLWSCYHTFTLYVFKFFFWIWPHQVCNILTSTLLSAVFYWSDMVENNNLITSGCRNWQEHGFFIYTKLTKLYALSIHIVQLIDSCCSFSTMDRVVWIIFFLICCNLSTKLSIKPRYG